MDIPFVVQELESRDQLISQHDSSLQRELPLADVEEVLKGGTQKLHNHCIVLRLKETLPVHLWHSNSTL